MIQKPITVARAEFIENLTSLINTSGLPSFMIEPILKDFLSDIRLMAQQQLETDRKRYNELLEAEKE